MTDLRYLIGIVLILAAVGLMKVDQSVWSLFPAGAAVFVLGTVLKDNLR